MRDLFGIAVAVVIAGLSQIVQPWSLWWDVGMAIALLIAAGSGLDLLGKNTRFLRRGASSPKEIEPDWRIDELFSYLDPNVLDRSRANRAPWEKVGNQIRDQLALGRLRVWGRTCHADGKLFGETSPLQEIRPNYWYAAHFTYDFFDGTAKDKPHTYVFSGHSECRYTDIRISSIEAKKLWPR